MEDLKIGKCYGVREYDGGVELGFSSVEGNTMEHYPYSRKGFEKLIEWGQQWLKENPEKKAMLLLDCGGPFKYTFRTREELDEHLIKFPQLTPEAIIPISYHIGEGLETDD